MCDSAFAPAVAKRETARAAERIEKDIVGVKTDVVSKERRGKAYVCLRSPVARWRERGRTEDKVGSNARA